MIPAHRSTFLYRRFLAYNRLYLQRSFHAIHLSGPAESVVSDGHTPILVYLSHSSWWDLLIAAFVNDSFFRWESYGVMDERQLRRYAFFSRLGVIGVDRTSLRGAKEFLGYARTFLAGQPRALWMTPQGEMVSNQRRPLRFQPGLAHLVEVVGECFCIPVAIDYEFWMDKQPEAFVAYGKPERVAAGPGFDRRKFLQECQERLEREIDALTALRMQRDPGLFRTLLQGKGSISPVYDAMRALTALARGERFEAEHGAVRTEAYRARGEGQGDEVKG